MKIGDTVLIKDTSAMKAWGHAGKTGVIIGGDPRGFNDEVFCVKLSTPSILEAKGVNREHLKVLPKKRSARKGEA